MSMFEPEDFGAAGNGTTDDTASFAAAGAALPNGGIIRLRQGSNYLIDNNLYLPDGVSIEGYLTGGGQITSDASGATRLFKLNSRLIISSQAAIFLGNACSVSRCFVIRKGMVGPENSASAYAGTAFITSGSDTGLYDLYILGFGQAFSGSGCGRSTIRGIKWDCISGFIATSTADTPRWSDCHGWPFGTINAANPVQPFDTAHFLFRAGVAYKFVGLNDFFSLKDLFSFGYMTGFEFSGYSGAGCANILAIGCSADGLREYGPRTTEAETPKPPIIPNTVAWNIHSCVDMLMMIGCKAAAQDFGVVVDTGDQDGATNAETQIIGLQCWGVRNGIRHLSGKLNVISPKLRGIYLPGNAAAGATAGIGCLVQSSAGAKCLISAPQVSDFASAFNGDNGSGLKIANPFEVLGPVANAKCPSLSISDTTALDYRWDTVIVTGGSTGSLAVTYPSHEVTFIFSASGVNFYSGGTMRLTTGTYTSTVNASLTLRCVGASWIETRRTAGTDATAVSY